MNHPNLLKTQKGEKILMKYPRIYLVLDNCFAIKRWIKPSEWMKIIKDIGFTYVQASTDNEFDPIFFPEDYCLDWMEEVKKEEKATGLKVINFYSGYQTYRTAGLGHYDYRVREMLIEKWFKPLIRRAADLDAKGIGFHVFALTDDVLQDNDKYLETSEIITDYLAEISKYAYENNKIQISFEQMYAPHQPPWTIEGTFEYLEKIYNKYKTPGYVTIDVGHMVGQKKFLKPSKKIIKDSLTDFSARNGNMKIWLGADSAYALWDKLKNSIKGEEKIESAACQISEEMDKYPYFFSDKDDADIYKWIEELAVYSPIIHMQQTNGITSSHAPFTAENNKTGVVKGRQLIESIVKSFEKQKEKNMPSFVEDIYLSFELFASNTDTKREIIYRLRETLEYWRQFVPEDGLPLEKIL